MEYKIMNLHTKKLGRNDPCICGSGVKYKKCCLNATTTAEKETQEMASFSQKTKDLYPDSTHTINDSNDGKVIKMSEVIINFASQLLDLSKTHEERKKSIELSIIAWNIALLDKRERKQEIDRFLDSIPLKKGSEDWKFSEGVLNMLIQKKQTLYPSLKRFIMNFELIRLKDGFHLNIASTTPFE